MLSCDFTDCCLEAQHTDIAHNATIHLAKRFARVGNFVSSRLSQLSCSYVRSAATIKALDQHCEGIDEFLGSSSTRRNSAGHASWHGISQITFCWIEYAGQLGYDVQSLLHKEASSRML